MKMLCAVCQEPLKYEIENDDPEDFTYEVQLCENCMDNLFNDAYIQGYNEGVESVETEDEPESE